MERDRQAMPLRLHHLAWSIPSSTASSTPTSGAALAAANGRTEGREPGRPDLILVLLHEVGDAAVKVVVRGVEVGFAGARPVQGTVDPFFSSPQLATSNIGDSTIPADGALNVVPPRAACSGIDRGPSVNSSSTYTRPSSITGVPFCAMGLSTTLPDSTSTTACSPTFSSMHRGVRVSQRTSP